MASAEQQHGGDHLAVLVHGLWGTPGHLNYMRDALQNAYSKDRLHVLVVRSLDENKTYDGIEVGGERIAYEIEQKLAELKNEGHVITKISMTGYSLGGLIARYAVGLMYSNGLFDRIKPVNFVTFATPHLGVRTPKLGYRSTIWNFMGARTLSTSGQQLFLIDDFRATGRNILSILADPNSVFMKGLSLFKNKWLYANTLNDRSVPYYTAMMSRTDPYVAPDSIDVHFLQDQPSPGDVILDPEDPVTPRKSHLEDLSYYERLQMIPRRTINNAPFYLIMISLLPIALPLFMLNAGYQTYKSVQRVAHHEAGKAFQLNRYRIKLLEEAQAVQDRAYTQLADQQTEEYLPTPPPETLPTDGTSSADQKIKAAADLGRKEGHKEDGDFPILALKEEQFEMIDNLDKLGFIKYPVHIQKVRHTHAAVVVRKQKDSFAEGKIIVQHWIEKLEI